jgi:hypothetical protein
MSVPLGKAGPAPFLGLADKVCAERVTLDVATDRQEVFVLLDGKRFVEALIQVTVTDGMAVEVPASDVCGGQALHEAAELGVMAWPEDEMPVIGHQAIGEKAHVQALKRLSQQCDKRGVVGLFAEDVHSRISAV